LVHIKRIVGSTEKNGGRKHGGRVAGIAVVFLKFAALGYYDTGVLLNLSALPGTSLKNEDRS
jgi:hypothetical protein